MKWPARLPSSPEPCGSAPDHRLTGALQVGSPSRLEAESLEVEAREVELL
ncbi:MAG: hypothetical protein OXG81_08675 [Acidobacteria bacterium]|nr:hypothetical protein [Acidobacteriota bacterium]